MLLVVNRYDVAHKGVLIRAEMPCPEKITKWFSSMNITKWNNFYPERPRFSNFEKHEPKGVKMNVRLQAIHDRMHRFFHIIPHIGQAALLSLVLAFPMGIPSLLQAEPIGPMTKEQAVKLGEDFGIIVGEVDKEIQEFLGLERAQGVVVFEVIGGKPAALAGIKPQALIKEINSVEVATLEDFGLALQDALPTENFSVATYEPADPDNQGISGGINFHSVRIEKS